MCIEKWVVLTTSRFRLLSLQRDVTNVSNYIWIITDYWTFHQRCISAECLCYLSRVAHFFKVRQWYSYIKKLIITVNCSQTIFSWKNGSWLLEMGMARNNICHHNIGHRLREFRTSSCPFLCWNSPTDRCFHPGIFLSTKANQMFIKRKNVQNA